MNRGQVVALHKPAATGFAQLPGQLVEEPTLPSDAFRVLAIIRLHDYGRGGGCFLSRAEIARRGCMSEATAKRALRQLRERGLIHTETSSDGKSNNVHHWAADGGHTDPRVALTPVGGSQGPPRGVTQTRDGGHTDPPLYKEEVEDYEVDEIEVDATTRDAGEEQAQRLCAALGIAASKASLQAMVRVVNDLAAKSPRSLDDLALDAASWLESHQQGANVPFFRRWVEREIAGTPAGRVTDGEHRGRARTDATAADAAARRRDRVTDERLKRHLARGGTEKSFFGL